MAWMLRVVASLGVIKPFEDQLGRCWWWKELRLKQDCYGMEKLAHFKFLFQDLFHPYPEPVVCACCFKTGCCFVVDASLFSQGLRNSFFAAETFLPGMLFLKRP